MMKELFLNFTSISIDALDYITYVYLSEMKKLSEIGSNQIFLPII